MTEKKIRKGRGSSSPGIKVEIDIDAMNAFHNRYRHEHRLIKSKILEKDGKGYFFIGSVAIDNESGEICCIDCHIIDSDSDKDIYIGFNENVKVWLGEGDFIEDDHIPRIAEKYSSYKEAISKPIVNSEDYAEGGKYFYLVEKYYDMQSKRSNIDAMTRKTPKFIR